MSLFRKLYAPVYNPVTDQEEGSDITFPDFIQLVVEGPIELSKFLEETQVNDGLKFWYYNNSYNDGPLNDVCPKLLLPS